MHFIFEAISFWSDNFAQSPPYLWPSPLVSKSDEIRTELGSSKAAV